MQKGNRMRLIDADALLEQMQPVSGFEVNNCAEALVMTIANAYIKLVEKQPTVQPDTNCSEFPNNSDTISRTQAIDAMESEIVSTNPEHFKSSEKFIKFMDDADITAIAKPLSVVIIIISFIVLFFSRNDVAVAISAFMFLVGMIVLLATTVIDMVEGW